MGKPSVDKEENLLKVKTDLLCSKLRFDISMETCNEVCELVFTRSSGHSGDFKIAYDDVCELLERNISQGQ